MERDLTDCLRGPRRRGTDVWTWGGLDACRRQADALLVDALTV